MRPSLSLTIARCCPLLLLLPLGLGGCIWESFGECTHKSEDLEPGEIRDGVSPETVLAPLFATHTGVLTWHATNTTTPLTFTLNQTEPYQYDIEDCPSGLTHGFSGTGHWTVQSGDGLVDNEGNVTVVLDDNGAVLRPLWFDLGLEYNALVAAGLGHPDLLKDPAVFGGVGIAQDTLKPLPSAITISLGSGETYELGTITFGE